jgi:hypothetical protein
MARGQKTFPNVRSLEAVKRFVCAAKESCVGLYRRARASDMNCVTNHSENFFSASHRSDKRAHSSSIGDVEEPSVAMKRRG